MQKLSGRLQAVADFVTAGSRTADIGTDHGFLPIYLIQSGRCPHVIAMDIRKGPLMRAQEHIAAAGLEAVIQTRLSDGMQELKKGEADSVVIAGMGGMTVLHILEEAGHVLPQLEELVLEPQSDPAKVRRYVREHQMYIDKEDLVYDAGKLYPVLHVVHAQTIESGEAWEKAEAQMIKSGEAWKRKRREVFLQLQERLAEPERVQDLLDRYGEYLICVKHPVLKKLLEREEQRERRILCELEKGMGEAFGQQCVGERFTCRRVEAGMRLEEIRVLTEILVE